MSNYDVDKNGTHLQPDGYNPASDNYPFGYGQTNDPFSRGNSPKRDVKPRDYVSGRVSGGISSEDRRAIAENKKSIEALKTRKTEAFEAYSAKYRNSSPFYRLTHKNPKKGIESFSTADLERMSGAKKGR